MGNWQVEQTRRAAEMMRAQMDAQWAEAERAFEQDRRDAQRMTRLSTAGCVALGALTWAALAITIWRML